MNQVQPITISVVSIRDSFGCYETALSKNSMDLYSILQIFIQSIHIKLIYLLTAWNWTISFFYVIFFSVHKRLQPICPHTYTKMLSLVTEYMYNIEFILLSWPDNLLYWNHIVFLHHYNLMKYIFFFLVFGYVLFAQFTQ